MTETVDSGSRRILYVEDDPHCGEIVRAALQPPHEVSVLSDGLEALRHMRTTPPDLLILDLQLPTVSGFDVLEAMRAPSFRGRPPPVILLTGRVVGGEATQAAVLGCAAFMEKPFTLLDLRRTVSEALGEPSGSLAARGAGGQP